MTFPHIQEVQEDHFVPLHKHFIYEKTVLFKAIDSKEYHELKNKQTWVT